MPSPKKPAGKKPRGKGNSRPSFVKQGGSNRNITPQRGSKLQQDIDDLLED